MIVAPLNAVVEEVDENQNGVIDFPEFLTLYSMLSGEIQGEHVKKISLGKTAFYGRTALIRWIQNDDDAINGDVTGPLVPGVRAAARGAALNRSMEFFFYFCIIIAGTCSGLQTYDSMQDSPVILGFEWLTLFVFFVEVVLKLLAESSGQILGFFEDPWNLFDFVVLIGLLIMTPLGEGELAAVRILRMLRAVRILRAAKVLPKLTLVLETLIKSASSVMYIAGFLVLVMYIFAIVGVSLFHSNDPFHFGDLGKGMLSLWRISTVSCPCLRCLLTACSLTGDVLWPQLEDWTDIMYFNQFGCDWSGDYGGATGGSDCEPEAFGMIAVLYFSLYILLTSFLLLNLFIGVITDSMGQASAELHKEKKDAARLAIATRLRAKMERKLAAEGNPLNSPKALHNPVFGEEEDATYTE